MSDIVDALERIRLACMREDGSDIPLGEFLMKAKDEITALRAENEKRAEDGYDVYAAAREEYRKKIAEQAAENEKLRAALERIANRREYQLPSTQTIAREALRGKDE